LAYFSAAAYDRKINEAAIAQQKANDATTTNNKKTTRVKPIAPERLFLVGDDFIFDLRPPNNPRRVNGSKKQAMKFNAASAYPDGGALIVGPKGSIAYIP